METMLLVPVDDSVVFPTMTVTLAIDVGTEERVVLVPRKGDEFASVGTVAQVVDRVRLPGGGRAVALEGQHRASIGAARTDHEGRLRVEVEAHPDDVPVDGRTRELEREYRAVVEEILEMRGDDGRIAAFVRSITEPGALADTAGYSPDLNAWTDTAQEAMHLGREHWMRLMPDMGLGAYRIYQAEGQLSDPVWPDKPFEELLEIAFKGRVIDSPDHPVVRRLRGLT